MSSTFPSSDFIQVFATRADEHGVMPFDAFVDLALYDPAVGYYSAERERVGYGPGTDFFTASTSGPVFGELVAAACASLLGPAAAEHTFIEIGAEDDQGVLRNVNHPFRNVRVVRLGGTVELQGSCIVFSNELLDAQPFRRFRLQGGRWCELGVELREGTLREVPLGSIVRPVAPLEFPASAPEGYTIDAPLHAVVLTDIIARQPWTGLWVAFDYGKSAGELLQAAPAGTARAYHRHTQSNDLLAQPGRQDITCHVCWDWLVDVLTRRGFTAPQVVSQEAFFIRHAGSYIAPVIAADAARLTSRKQSLVQLLHGAHLGRKFQVLHARR